MRSQFIPLAIIAFLASTPAIAGQESAKDKVARFTLEASKFPICRDFLKMLNDPVNADYEMGQELTIPQAFVWNYTKPNWKPLPEAEWPDHLHPKEITRFKEQERTFEIAEFQMDQMPGPPAEIVLRSESLMPKNSARKLWIYHMSAQSYLFYGVYQEFNVMPPRVHSDIILKYPDSVGVTAGKEQNIGYDTYLLNKPRTQKALILYAPSIGEGRIITKDKNTDNIWPTILNLRAICKFIEVKNHD